MNEISDSKDVVKESLTPGGVVVVILCSVQKGEKTSMIQYLIRKELYCDHALSNATGVLRNSKP